MPDVTLCRCRSSQSAVPVLMKIGFGIVCTNSEHIGVTLTVAVPPKPAMREASARGKSSGPRATDGLEERPSSLVVGRTSSVVTRPPFSGRRLINRALGLARWVKTLGDFSRSTQCRADMALHRPELSVPDGVTAQFRKRLPNLRPIPLTGAGPKPAEDREACRQALRRTSLAQQKFDPHRAATSCRHRPGTPLPDGSSDPQ